MIPISFVPASPSTSSPPAFHIMLKPRGAICNLECAYCYYLSKKRLYPDGTFWMSDALLEEYTRQYIEAQRVPEVTFGWQGGEPTLMGLDFFRRAVELQTKYAKPGMRITNALQTNAMTLDDEWAQFFHDHRFLLGVSLDGPLEFHDAYRVDKGGAPTFERVMAGIETLKRHAVEFNLLATVNAANANHPLEVYRFLVDQAGAQAGRDAPVYIQFIPIVERQDHTEFPGGEKVTPRSVTGKQYGDFLIAIFNEWVRRDIGRVFVQIFDVALSVWMGRRSELCIFSETCGTALAMEHNGDIFSCDHFVEPRYQLGNLAKTSLLDIVASSSQRQFGIDKRDKLPSDCRECPIRFICNGGCPKDRIAQTSKGELGLNYLCEGFKAFFSHISHPMKTMVSLINRQHPPTEIMHLLACEERGLQFEEVGRNDLCPCGSGAKFKHCHGGSPQVRSYPKKSL